MFLIPRAWYSITTTKKTGRAALAIRTIEPGTVIGDYLGTITKPSHAHDESKYGLYDMEGGLTYDILADPRSRGIELINSSCAPNCAMYPYQGHVLYFALRKIWPGEELTVYYHIGVADEHDIACARHACHCGSKICTGTFHESSSSLNAWYGAWLKLVKKNFGPFYKKTPGKYGEKILPLEQYPSLITVDDWAVYPDIFGAEIKPVAKYHDASLPGLSEIRKRIRETGRQLAFPKLHLVVYGIRSQMLLVRLAGIGPATFPM